MTFLKEDGLLVAKNGLPLAVINYSFEGDIFYTKPESFDK
jgi:hypothetical protein